MRNIQLFDIINNTLLSILAFVCVYPFLTTLAVSLSDGFAVAAGKVFLYPVNFTLDTYAYIFGNPRLGISRAVLNSVLYTTAGTVIAVVATFLTAYSLSKKRLAGRYVIMMIFVFTMLFDGGLIPSYLVNQALGFVNNPLVMVVPGAITVFLLIITRTFLEEIPIDLEETAFMDGANDFQIMWKVYFPLSTPVMATIGIFYAIGIWNQFLVPLIYLQERVWHPIQLILYNLVIRPNPGGAALETIIRDDVALLPKNIEAAVIVLATVPILLVYPFAQRYFTTGMMLGAIKG